MHKDDGLGLLQAEAAARPERFWWCPTCQDYFPAGVAHPHLTIHPGPDRLVSDAPHS